MSLAQLEALSGAQRVLWTFFALGFTYQATYSLLVDVDGGVCGLRKIYLQTLLRAEKYPTPCSFFELKKII